MDEWTRISTGRPWSRGPTEPVALAAANMAAPCKCHDAARRRRLWPFTTVSNGGTASDSESERDRAETVGGGNGPATHVKFESVSRLPVRQPQPDSD